MSIFGKMNPNNSDFCCFSVKQNKKALVCPIQNQIPVMIYIQNNWLES